MLFAYIIQGKISDQINNNSFFQAWTESQLYGSTVWERSSQLSFYIVLINIFLFLLSFMLTLTLISYLQQPKVLMKAHEPNVLL